LVEFSKFLPKRQSDGDSRESTSSVFRQKVPTVIRFKARLETLFDQIPPVIVALATFSDKSGHFIYKIGLTQRKWPKSSIIVNLNCQLGKEKMKSTLSLILGKLFDRMIMYRYDQRYSNLWLYITSEKFDKTVEFFADSVIRCNNKN
jgi:hypothetical protein